MNSKFTFGDIKEVIRVGGCMGHYPYIAHRIALGLHEVKSNVNVMVFTLIRFKCKSMN